MVKLRVYGKENCCLCDDAKEILRELQAEMAFEIEEIDIYQDDELLEKYQIIIPVVQVNTDMLGYGIIEKEEIKKQLAKYF
jgi:glutaredoxin